MREKITSAQNPKLKKYASLLEKKYRSKEHLFLVEGKHLVEEAQKNGFLVEVLSTDDKTSGTLVSPYLFKKLTGPHSNVTVIGVVKKMIPQQVGSKILALCNVQDPGNVGTLIRTALAFGFTDVIVEGADIFNPKTLRSTQGAIFGINLIQAHNVFDHIPTNYQKIGAILDKEAQVYTEVSCEPNFALILGNEGTGIPKDLHQYLTHKIYIPINFESLNVASAGAILMNEYKGI